MWEREKRPCITKVSSSRSPSDRPYNDDESGRNDHHDLYHNGYNDDSMYRRNNSQRASSGRANRENSITLNAIDSPPAFNHQAATARRQTVSHFSNYNGDYDSPNHSSYGDLDPSNHHRDLDDGVRGTNSFNGGHIAMDDAVTNALFSRSYNRSFFSNNNNINGNDAGYNASFPTSSSPSPPPPFISSRPYATTTQPGAYSLRLVQPTDTATSTNTSTINTVATAHYNHDQHEDEWDPTDQRSSTNDSNTNISDDPTNPASVAVVLVVVDDGENGASHDDNHPNVAHNQSRSTETSATPSTPTPNRSHDSSRLHRIKTVTIDFLSKPSSEWSKSHWTINLGAALSYIMVIVALSTRFAIVTNKNNNFNSSFGNNDDQEDDGHEQDCDFTDLDYVSPFLQCQCHGTISRINNAVRDQYDALRQIQLQNYQSVHDDGTTTPNDTQLKEENLLLFFALDPENNTNHSLVAFASTTTPFPKMNSCTAENMALTWIAMELASSKSEAGAATASTITSTITTSIRNRFVLAYLYGIWNGPEWIQNTNWVQFGVSECDWFGVECEKKDSNDDNNKVVSLSMPKNDVRGPLVSHTIGSYFKDLRTFDLATNRLIGTIPDDFWKLSKLETLKLHENSAIEMTLPTTLGDMTALQIINLSMTIIAGPLPESIVQLTELREIDLSLTFTSGTIPTMIWALSQLTKFRFDETWITGSFPEEFWNISTLEYIQPSSYHSVSTIPTLIGGLTSLKVLSWNHASLEGTIPTELGRCTKLSTLALNHNYIQGSLPSELGSLVNLELLDIERNRQLQGTVPHEYQNLHQLRHMILTETDLSGIIPENICQYDSTGKSLTTIEFSPQQSAGTECSCCV